MHNLVSILQLVLGIGMLIFAAVYVARVGINNLVSRLAIIVSIVLVAHGGFYAVRAGTQPPEVLLPEQTMHDLPRQLGGWVGEDGQLDPKIFARTGAYDAVDRFYQDSSGNKVSLFVALYTNPAEGLYHSAMNCYRSSGWTLISEKSIPLGVKDRPDIAVSASIWELRGERILVVYWYELGDYTLFERMDLAKIRWALRGQKTWPPMYKVLLQMPMSDPERSKERLLDIAGNIHKWLAGLNQSSASAGTNP